MRRHWRIKEKQKTENYFLFNGWHCKKIGTYFNFLKCQCRNCWHCRFLASVFHVSIFIDAQWQNNSLCCALTPSKVNGGYFFRKLDNAFYNLFCTIFRSTFPVTIIVSWHLEKFRNEKIYRVLLRMKLGLAIKFSKNDFDDIPKEVKKRKGQLNLS